MDFVIFDILKFSTLNRVEMINFILRLYIIPLHFEIKSIKMRKWKWKMFFSVFLWNEIIINLNRQSCGGWNFSPSFFILKNTTRIKYKSKLNEPESEWVEIIKASKRFQVNGETFHVFWFHYIHISKRWDLSIFSRPRTFRVMRAPENWNEWNEN